MPQEILFLNRVMLIGTRGLGAGLSFAHSACLSRKRLAARIQCSAPTPLRPGSRSCHGSKDPHHQDGASPPSWSCYHGTRGSKRAHGHESLCSGPEQAWGLLSTPLAGSLQVETPRHKACGGGWGGQWALGQEATAGKVPWAQVRKWGAVQERSRWASRGREWW